MTEEKAMKVKLITFVLAIILINIGMLFTATSALANDESTISSSTDAIPFPSDQPQSQDNTIFLPRDCAVYGTWDESTKTCKLTQDLTQSVEITASNTTLDCDGYKISGNNTGYGVYLNNEDIIIKNCTLSNFYQGIFSYDNTFTISNSTSSSSTYGIYSYSTRQSPFYVLKSNFSYNTYGIYSYSSFASRYGNAYISTSTFSHNAYGIYSANYCAISASYSTFTDNDYGIYGYWKLSIVTDHSAFSGNTYGISGNDIWGISVSFSALSGSNYALYGEGMADFNSDNSSFSNNEYAMYSYHMYDDGDPRALMVYSNGFSGNNNTALYINNYGGVETEIYQSVFSNNTLGINIFSVSPSARIYLNNFVNNTDHVNSHNSLNIWNSPEEITYTYNFSTYTNYLGNYWSGYPGTDTDDNGIGDIPYAIDLENQDNYPLIIPFENYLKPIPEMMIKPTIGGKIICKFHCYLNPKKNSFHEGIDIDDSLFQTPVNAVAAGKLVLAKNSTTTDAGRVVWIDHGDVMKLNGVIVSQISTRYLHLDKIDPAILNLHTGDFISRGTIIGSVGRSGLGFADTPHLHFEVRQGDTSPGNYKFTTATDPLIEKFIEYPVTPHEFFIYSSADPPDLIIRDPDGLIISKTINQLPGITRYIDVNYVGPDEGGGIGGYDKAIFDQLKQGDYLITIVSGVDSLPTDFYTLKAISNGQTIILAENARIVEAPEQPYIIRVSEIGIKKITPAIVRIEPETLNLNSNGIFTVFIQFPRGFGVSVGDIDPESITAYGVHPIKIQIARDTLIAKFRTQDLSDVLLGKNIEFKIIGELKDANIFEGIDTIRVIRSQFINLSSLSAMLAPLREILEGLFGILREIF